MLGEAVALPAALVDDFLKLAGEVQLKTLLWVLRNGSGSFDAKTCARAIGKNAADCADAMQFWMQQGVLCERLPDQALKTQQSDAPYKFDNAEIKKAYLGG